MRILVTGSREWDDWGELSRVFTEIARQTFQLDVTLVHGGARGADWMAAKAARMLGWTIEEHPADWGRYGKGAGHIRNQEMVDAGADVCLAFFRSDLPNRGTADCVRRAELAGIPVKPYWSDPGEGDHDPTGNSPDSPAPGEARLPGGSDDYLPAGATTLDPRQQQWGPIPGEYVSMGLTPALVTLDCEHWYEVPDGTSVSDFLAELTGNRPLGPSLKKFQNSP